MQSSAARGETAGRVAFRASGGRALTSAFRAKWACGSWTFWIAVRRSA